MNAMVVEASAKSGDAISTTFEQVVSIYFERAEATNKKAGAAQGQGEQKKAKVDGSNAQAEKKGKCCS